MISGPFDFDSDKSEANRLKHGLSLDEFSGFDHDPAVIQDTRVDYGEERFRAFGHIGGIGYMIAFTLRDDRIRLISFRRAREREIERYER